MPGPFRSSLTNFSACRTVLTAITNEELASAAAITLFAASRFMSEWQRSGAVVKTRGKILVRSFDCLYPEVRKSTRTGAKDFQEPVVLNPSRIVPQRPSPAPAKRGLSRTCRQYAGYFTITGASPGSSVTFASVSNRRTAQRRSHR